MPKARKPAARSAPERRAALPVALTAAIIPLGVWLAVTPYVAPALGFVLELDPIVEVIDHVVPGVVLVVAAASVLLLRRRPSAPYAFAVATGLSVLGGLWATATHLPLLLQARQGLAPWGAAIFHSTPGLVILAVGLAAFVPALRNVD